MASWFRRRPAQKGPLRLGLALGGGGVRGLAHIGVLQTLERNGIPIDAIAGTSMGAIVGATYALHPRFGREIFDAVVRELKRALPARLSAEPADQNSFLERVRQFVDVEKFIFETTLGWGILPATLAPATVSSLVRGKNLEDGRIPVAVVAIDLRTGKKEIFTKGSASVAVEASSALPGFFPPVEFDGKLLADGGIVDLVPVAEARAMQVDIVVAVDVDQDQGNVEIQNGLEAFLRAIEICSRHHNQQNLVHADVIIRPDFGEPVKTFMVTKADKCFTAGERAAEKAIPEIRRLLKMS